MTMTIRTRRILAIVAGAVALCPVVVSAVIAPPMWLIGLCGFAVAGIGIADRQIDSPPEPEEEERKPGSPYR